MGPAYTRLSALVLCSTDEDEDSGYGSPTVILYFNVMDSTVTSMHLEREAPPRSQLHPASAQTAVSVNRITFIWLLPLYFSFFSVSKPRGSLLRFTNFLPGQTTALAHWGGPKKVCTNGEGPGRPQTLYVQDKRLAAQSQVISKVSFKP